MKFFPNNANAGVVRCLRYALIPNQLTLCGPNNQCDILDFKNRAEEGKKINLGVEYLLKKFETLYPYLCLIAKENKISDPFDERVVDAYWLGNKLLDNVRKKYYFKFLQDKLDGIGQAQKEIRELFVKDSKKILPNHNFHVTQVYREGGKSQGMSVINILEQCRISAGLVVSLGEGNITVRKKEIIFENSSNKLKLSKPREKIIPTSWQDLELIANIKVGDYISIHWGFPCERITREKAENLEKHTLDAIGMD
jgi:hypothetical protein